MTVQATTGARPVASSGMRGHVEIPGGVLLPSPAVLGADVTDGLLAVQALGAKLSQTDLRAGQSEVRRFQTASREQMKKMLEAIDRQRTLEREQRSGFWAKLGSIASTISKIASVVAGVAAVVGSGGAALPLIAGVAAVALSGGGMAVRELRLFGDASDKIALGMEIGGAVVGVGGAIGAFWLGGAQASGAVAKAGTVVNATAQGVNAVAIGGGSVATVELAAIRRDADRAQADSEEAKGEQARRSQQMHQVLDWLQTVQDNERESVETTAKILETNNQAAQAAIIGVKG